MIIVKNEIISFNNLLKGVFIFRSVLSDRPTRLALAFVRMSQVRIPPQFWFDQLPNFKPDDSMAECHARRAGERIAEKKAEGNVEKLEQLVDQLKGKIDSKDTIINAEVKSPKIIEFFIQIPLTGKSSKRFWFREY